MNLKLFFTNHRPFLRRFPYSLAAILPSYYYTAATDKQRVSGKNLASEKERDPVDGFSHERFRTLQRTGVFVSLYRAAFLTGIARSLVTINETHAYDTCTRGKRILWKVVKIRGYSWPEERIAYFGRRNERRRDLSARCNKICLFLQKRSNENIHAVRGIIECSCA